MKSFLLFLVIFLQGELNADFIITKVDRSIDLTSQLVKISSQITLKNTGNEATNDVVIGVDENQIKYLSYIEAAVSVLFVVCLLK